jgi:hypothetical protein
MEAKMKRSERLRVLENIFKVAEKSEYGGKGPFNLPKNHKPFMKITKGGSSCKNCVFVNAEKHECNNKYYIEWNGGDKKLPESSLDEMCSDWWSDK